MTSDCVTDMHLCNELKTGAQGRKGLGPGGRCRRGEGRCNRSVKRLAGFGTDLRLCDELKAGGWGGQPAWSGDRGTWCSWGLGGSGG
jgi:hypothetical protein